MGPKKIGAMGRNFAIESSRQARICGAMRQIFCGGINVQIFRHTATHREHRRNADRDE